MVSKRAVGAAIAAAVAGIVGVSTAQPGIAAEKGQQPPAASRSAQRIAAVVNDQAVSVADVEARLKLMLLNAGLPDNADVRQRLQPQVLRQLVDEQLQLQEAKRTGATASMEEVYQAIDQIAQQNRMNRQQLEALLRSRSISPSTLHSQLQAALSWQKVIQRRIRQEVQIGDEEVDAALEQAKANIGKPEYLAAEIFLAVDNPSQDEQVRRAAERLIEDIRRGGNFAAVARQFSQSAGAQNGGDLGWVRPGELSDELDTALQGMRPGQLSPPVRTAAGYHIMLVRDRRTFGSSTSEMAQARAAQPAPRPVRREPPKVEVSNNATARVVQIVFPAESPEQRKPAAEQAEKLRRSVKGCSNFLARAKASGQEQSGDLGSVRIKDMPAQLGQLVAMIPIGQASPVLSGDAGSLVLMVCSRSGVTITQPEPPPQQAEAPPPPPPAPAGPAAMPTRDEIERELMNERAELLSRRYLRDLRRASFVEYRV